MNVVIVAQQGRLAVQALLFAESHAASGSAAGHPLFVAVPRPSPLWESDPTPEAPFLDRYRALGATLVSFDNRHFGARCAYLNKVYALFELPAGQPFLFLDTDQLIFSDLGRLDLDFDHPSARLAAAAWPPGKSRFAAAEVWRAVYRLTAQETGVGPGEGGSGRYFNAGAFYYNDPHRFGALMLQACLALEATDIPAIAEQPLLPAPLDQVALSAVIEALGEGPPCPEALNSIALTPTTASWHYHRFARFFLPGYERALDLVEEILKSEATAALVLQNPTLAFFRSDLGHQVAAKAERFVARHQDKLKFRDAGKLFRQLGFD